MKTILLKSIKSILQSNQNLLSIAIKQRAKFEGWLKFELAYELWKINPQTVVEYAIKGKHVDLFSNGALIELKTPNTKYQLDTVDKKCLSMTLNIQKIIDDIEKLRKLAPEVPSYVAFVMFPIDDVLYKGHIEKITKRIQKGNFVQEVVCINGVNVWSSCEE